MKRKLNKRALVLLVCISLILAATVGITLAYIFTSTDPVENTFTPAQVSCAVVDTEYTVSETKLIRYTVANTGNTAAYIRVAVVINWKSEDGRVYAAAPEIPDAYRQLGEGWNTGSDGYFYYKTPVAAGNSTGALLTVPDGVYAGPTGADGTQYYLSVEIVASAIQAEPGSVVAEQWGVTVADDGSISK